MQPVKLMPHDVATLPPAAASVRAARLSLARSHTAIFPTNLALARWTAGCCLPHLAGSAHPPLRAAWFARAQREFQAWLESGGFVQHDEPASSDDAVTLCDAAPDGTTN
ncbi:hypothetical protein [Massilia sp. Se16.2.3]|uniref:hypothetical protein n=1 Tax=Massilia sp. Se16.2.3 TaxID=2709303 RepID=UPI0016037B6A|nr:hypothetical protein [Massilia sp. Se16.2.3]QNB01008.1 hypothetical protein G4G31_22975 [Massilia sp. Se16.2.3]